MGGGAVQRSEIPHYSKYKIEDYPKFVKYQEKLASEGLKDPWIRNHLWRSTSKVTQNGKYPFYYQFLKGPGMFLGARIGLATVATYIIADQLVFKHYRSKGDHHGH